MDHAVLDVARRAVRGPRRGDDQPSAVPRVPPARRLEGRGGPLACPAGGSAAGERAGDRRPVQRPRDDRGRRSRRGHAPRATAGSRGGAVHRSAARRRGRRASSIERLVLAGPDVAARASARLAAEARAAADLAATGVTASAADRPGRRRRPGRGDPGPEGGGIVALPTDTVYGLAVDLASPGGIDRLFAAKRRPTRPGRHAAPRRRRPGRRTRRCGRPPRPPCGGVLAGRPDDRRRPAPGRRAAAGAHRRSVDGRASLAGPPAPRALAAALGPLPGHVRQRVRAARGVRRRRDPRPARRRDRSDPRWGTGPGRPAVDRRRLLRAHAPDPARRRDRDERDPPGASPKPGSPGRRARRSSGGRGRRAARPGGGRSRGRTARRTRT